MTLSSSVCFMKLDSSVQRIYLELQCLEQGFPSSVQSDFVSSDLKFILSDIRITKSTFSQFHLL